jgi:hypothetical protein
MRVGQRANLGAGTLRSRGQPKGAATMLGVYQSTVQRRLRAEQRAIDLSKGEADIAIRRGSQ